MEKPNRHIWEEDSTHRSVAGDEYDEVWDYAEWLEAKLQAAKISKAEHGRYREALKLVTHAIDKDTAAEFARKALGGES